MTKTKLYSLLWVVLGALNEARQSDALLRGCPNGHLYAALMNSMDINEWNALVRMLKASNLATESNYLLTITPKGVELFEKLDKILGDHAQLNKGIVPDERGDGPDAYPPIVRTNGRISDVG